MTEPKRWIDEGPPQAIERLLHAAAAERPPEASMSRTLTALGVGAGTASAASAAGAATVGGAAASAGKATGIFAASALVKWGLLAGAVTAAGLTGRAVVRSRAEQRALPAAVSALAPGARTLAPAPKTPTAAPLALPEAPATEVVPVPGEPPPEPAPLLPRGARGAVAPHPSVVSSRAEPRVAAEPEAPIDVERLAEEVALVDQARGAFARGDGAAAIAALDGYDARFKQQKFAPEALYLRMESLLKLGRTGAARAVAARLVSAYPKSPHTARARQVMSETIP